MDQTNQPKGNIIASPARYKQPGDKRPDFVGKITIPGTNRDFRLALWSSTYADSKTGEMKIVHSGRTSDISNSDSAMEQINAMAARDGVSKIIEEAGLKLDAGQIALFTNGFKTEEGVDPEVLAKRPDFYGRWNPGTGDKLVAVSVWARKGRDGGAFIAGATQYPLPGKEAGKEEAPERTLEDLVQTGDVTKGMSEGAPSRRRAGGRG
jgi:hypothetical protein